MSRDERSPRIVDISWGSIRVDGLGSPLKDAKLYPGGAREWDWKETGTRHTPGIQPADVSELVDHAVTVVILARGMNEMLSVKLETLDLLQDLGIETHVLQTEEAVRLYNQLRVSKRVGALIHSTC